VEKELKKMQDGGIIEPVEVSEWYWNANGIGQGVSAPMHDQHPQGLISIYSFTLWNFVKSSYLATFH